MNTCEKQRYACISPTLKEINDRIVPEQLGWFRSDMTRRCQLPSPRSIDKVDDMIYRDQDITQLTDQPAKVREWPG